MFHSGGGIHRLFAGQFQGQSSPHDGTACAYNKVPWKATVFDNLTGVLIQAEPAERMDVKPNILTPVRCNRVFIGQ